IDVLRQVHDDGHVAALAGEAGAAAAREDRRAVRPAHLHGGLDIVRVAGNDDANRHLPVVGGVGGVERAAAGIETNFAANGAPKFIGEIGHRQTGFYSDMAEWLMARWLSVRINPDV